MRFTQLLLGIMTALLVAGCMAKTAVLLDKNAKEKVALPGFPWVADLLMSFPEGTNEGYGPIFSDSRADRALVC